MHIKLGDIILGLLIIAVAVLLLVSFRPAEEQYKTAVVIENNKEIKRINLYGLQNTERIALNDGTQIVLEAENGRVKFIESSCPDKTCIHTGWIGGVGDIAVCLPNKVLVKIVGDNETQEKKDLDIIAE